MPLFEIVSLLALGGLAWFWYDSFQAREAAIRAAREACRSEGLQLLDDTVALDGLKPARDAEGRATLRRVYAFEYSDTGDNRRRGSVVLLGHRAIVINVGLRMTPAVRVLH